MNENLETVYERALFAACGLAFAWRHANAKPQAAAAKQIVV
jgi:hypothetical protein